MIGEQINHEKGQTMKKIIEKINANDLSARMQSNADFQLIDVREAIEYQTEHLPGSQNIPLSSFEKSMATLDANKPVYVLCRTGSRAAQAAELLQKKGYETICLIEGGLEALKSGGFKINAGATKSWAMDRQVRMGAGVMVLIGVIGFWLIHPGFLFLSAFVACGLIFSALTNTCGMALMLGQCPWNQIKK